MDLIPAFFRKAISERHRFSGVPWAQFLAVPIVPGYHSCGRRRGGDSWQWSCFLGLEPDRLTAGEPMFFKTQVVVVVLAISISSSFPASGQDSDASLSRRLLVDLWKKEGSNREDAVAAFQSASRDGLASTWDRKSFILQQMQHGKFRNVLPEAERFTALEPGDVEGWILRSWLNAVLDQYDRTLVDLQQLRKAIPEEAAESERQAAFAHMGRLAGYLQGPVRERVNPQSLRAALEMIAVGSSPAELAIFNEQNDAVLAEFERLTDLQAIALEEFEAKSKADTDAQIQTLQATNQSLDQRSQQIAPDISRLSTEASTKIADIRGRMAPVEQTLNLAGQTASRAELAVQSIWNEILLQENLLAQTRDPILRSAIIFRINDLQVQSQVAQGDLVSARNQFAQARSQLNGLSIEQAQISRQYDEQIRTLRNEQREIERQKRRNLAKIEKLTTGPVKVTGKAAQVKNEIPALTTYYPFPLEDFRQRWLDRMKTDGLGP